MNVPYRWANSLYATHVGLDQLAGAGFEPTISRLWALRVTGLLHPAIVYCMTAKVRSAVTLTHPQKFVTSFFQANGDGGSRTHDSALTALCLPKSLYAVHVGRSQTVHVIHF